MCKRFFDITILKEQVVAKCLYLSKKFYKHELRIDRKIIRKI